MTLSPAKRAAFGGLLTAAALIFAYVETLIPLQSIIPIAGVKLGLANICIMLGVYYLGIAEGLGLLLAKTVLTAILFGTPVSFVYSICGGGLSFVFLALSKRFLAKKLSLVGVSVASSAFHSIGQTLAACLMFGDISFLIFLEWLLPISVITGTVTGIAAVFLGRIAEERL